MKNYNIRVIRLRLNVAEQGEAKQKAWKRLYQITADSWRAANWIVRGQYLNDQLARRIYARRKIAPKADKAAVIDVEDQFYNYFGVKRQAMTERDIKQQFPNLPPCVTNPLNRVIVSNYKKDKGDMAFGRRSVRTYREGMPVQTTRDAIFFTRDDADNAENKKDYVVWKLGRSERLIFSIYYGQDRGNLRASVRQILAGTLDYAAPQIQVKNKKAFLLLPVKDPVKETALDPDLSVGVNLGLAVPAYVALSKGRAHKAIGSADDLLRTRVQMQNRRRRLHSALKSARGGQGRKRKLKALNHLEKKERNFVRTYNHFVSKQ